jgi:hypothetical protein
MASEDKVQQGSEKQRDPKRVWVQKMVKSAKLHHKLCPFYDRKKRFCFLKLGEKCPLDGRFENCSVFTGFLEKRYDEIVAAGKPLPIDFEDPLVQFGVA